MNNGQISKARSKPRNILRGIVPSYTGFDTATPTNLEKATNGVISDPVGTGTRTVAGADYIGAFIFDLGSIKTFLFSATFSAWSDTSTYICYVSTSNDGTNYKVNTPLTVSTATTSDGVTTSTMDVSTVLTGRYIRLRWRLAAAAAGNVKLFEAMGYELGL